MKISLNHFLGKSFGQAITFYDCKNLVVKDLKIKDAQQMHVSFENCVIVRAYNLVITAPEKSPNTDGIHVTNTQNMIISNCDIGTGTTHVLGIKLKRIL